MLREVEAKRRIVETIRQADGLIAGLDSLILRPLAAVYADHPDYREEWRP